MISPGMLPLIHEKFVGRDKPGLILHLDWKNVGRSVYTPGKDGRSEGVLAQMAAIEDVAAAGFDAVMTYLYLGQMDSRLERAEIERNAHIARDCEKYGIGLIIEPRSALEGTDVGSHSAPVMTTYCRIAADLGADLVKCVWPDSLETWQEITETCYVPVLLAGGPGGDDVPDTLRLARDTVDRGGAGVMFGRRVFCAKDPVDVLKQLGDVVHNGASVS
jgi:DhnA-type fructose-1,6-bisphosphate aldolase and related enzymes